MRRKSLSLILLALPILLMTSAGVNAQSAHHQHPWIFTCGEDAEVMSGTSIVIGPDEVRHKDLVLFGGSATVNGENFGAKEWGVAFSRCQGKIAPGFAILHPADGYGDLGAAVGPVLIGLAAAGLTDAYMRGPCLAWASSDAAARGATCITSIHS